MDSEYQADDPRHPNAPVHGAEDDDQRRSDLTIAEVVAGLGDVALAPVQLREPQLDDDEDGQPPRRGVASSATVAHMRAIMAVCKQLGLRVMEAPGWETRGRSILTPAYSIQHHTAVTNDCDYVLINGRSDLTGPLCNFAHHSDGTVVAIAAGRANHVGVGTVTNSESYGIETTGPVPLTASGPPAFPEYATGVLLQAAICIHHRWDPKARVLGHKEVARPLGRKVDPAYDMNAMRNAVAAAIAAHTHNVSGGDLSIVDAATKTYLDNQFNTLMRGTAAGKLDSHPYNLEEIRTRLLNLTQTVELIRLGDNPDPAGGDTHPQNLDSIWKALNAVRADVISLKETLGRVETALTAK